MSVYTRILGNCQWTEKRFRLEQSPQFKCVYAREGFIIGNLFTNFLLFIKHTEFYLIYLDHIYTKAEKHAAN